MKYNLLLLVFIYLSNQERCRGLFRVVIRRRFCAGFKCPRFRAVCALTAATGSIPAYASSAAAALFLVLSLLSRRKTADDIRKLSNLRHSFGKSKSSDTSLQLFTNDEQKLSDT